MKQLRKNIFTAAAVICAVGGITVSSGRFCIPAEAYMLEADEAYYHLGGYAYDQLDTEVQDIYDQLYEGIATKDDSFSVRASDSELIKPALSAILADHPEFFWIDGTASMSGFVHLKNWDITLGFNIDGSQIDAVEAEIEAKADAFYATLPPEASDYRKAKMAYEYIINTTDYSLESEQNQNIQSVFLNGVSVCAGYARAYQYLCHGMGLPCAYIEGTVTTDGREEGHAWNMVSLDGSYVFVDPPWGDPTYGEDETDAKRLSIIYDYFGLTTDEMTRAHHVPDGTYELPYCTDTSYDYYRINDMYYEYADSDQISRALWDAVDNNVTMVAMKFGSSGEYYDAYEKLFPSSEGRESLIDSPMQKRMEWDGLSSIRYYYSCSEELRIIKVYW